MTNQYSYELSLNILKALGGDITVQYENTDQIWAAIDGIYAASGDGLDLQALVLNITENGTYDYNITDEVDAYVPVNITVDIKQKYTDEQVEDLKDTAREEGYTSGYDKGVADGYVQGESEGYTDGYAEGLEDGAEDQKALLEDITVTENGVYEKEDGYKKVTVEVPEPIFETETLTVELTDNGTYNYTPEKDGYSSVEVTVDVASSGGGDGFDFSVLGYDAESSEECNKETKDKIEYSKTILEKWNPNVTSLSNKFKNDIKLKYCPLVSTSKVTNMSNMFSSCSNLTYLPQLDTSNVTNMSNMFSSCSNLTYLPQLDTSNVTDMSYMFYNCTSLTSIPQLDASNVTNMDSMFQKCSSLTSIPKLYCGKIISGNNMRIFGYSSTNMNNLTDLGGFEDLGKVSGFSKPTLFLQKCPNLTKESVVNVINNLYDRKSAGYSVVTLPFNSNSLALLSDEEKAIATNKGWTLS